MTCCNCWKKIQYMPEILGMIMYFIYTMSVPVFEQYFFKRYSEEYGYNYSIDGSSSKGKCDQENVTDPVLTKVQDAVSVFLATNSFCLLVPSIIFGLLYGPLSDRVGRKPVLLLNISGFLIMVVSVILVEIFNLNLFFVHLGSVFFGIGGYFTVGSVILQTYLSDVVEGDKLPGRIGILNMALFLALATSNFISGIVLEALGFLLTLCIIGGLAIVVILMALLQLAESLPKEKRAISGSLLEIPKKIWLLLRVERPDKWRFYYMVPLEIFAAFVQQEDGVILLRLLNAPFCFSPVNVGMFRGSHYIVTGIGSAFLLQVLPMFTHTGFAVVVAFLSSSAYNVTFGLSSSTLVVYMAVIGGMFLNAHTPVSRGVLSSSVNDFERGTMFGVLSTVMSLMSLLASFVNQYFYRVGNDKGQPGSVFIGIGCVPILPIIIVLVYIVKDLKEERKKKNTTSIDPRHDVEEVTKSIQDEERQPLLT